MILVSQWLHSLHSLYTHIPVYVWDLSQSVVYHWLISDLELPVKYKATLRCMMILVSQWLHSLYTHISCVRFKPKCRVSLAHIWSCFPLNSPEDLWRRRVLSHHEDAGDRLYATVSRVPSRHENAEPAGDAGLGLPSIKHNFLGGH